MNKTFQYLLCIALGFLLGSTFNTVQTVSNIGVKRGAFTEMTVTSDTTVREINEARLAENLPTLFYAPALQEFADKRLAEVKTGWFATNKCSHDGFRSSNMSNIYGRPLSENLSCGFSDVDSMMNAWKASPTHWAAITNPNYQTLTVATDGTITVTLFSIK